MQEPPPEPDSSLSVETCSRHSRACHWVCCGTASAGEGVKQGGEAVQVFNGGTLLIGIRKWNWATARGFSCLPNWCLSRTKGQSARGKRGDTQPLEALGHFLLKEGRPETQGKLRGPWAAAETQFWQRGWGALFPIQMFDGYFWSQSVKVRPVNSQTSRNSFTHPMDSLCLD